MSADTPRTTSVTACDHYWIGNVCAKCGVDHSINANERIARLERELAEARAALAEQLATYNDQQKQLENARKAYSSLEAESRLEREALAKVHSPASGVWLWQGDGSDYPESMANRMPVVMSGETLRGIQSQLTTQRAALEKADKVIRYAKARIAYASVGEREWHECAHEALTTINAALEEKK